jgi:RNA polymerase sigma-70 factor (ECF subfamily)
MAAEFPDFVADCRPQDRAVLDEMMPAVYRELRKLAGACLRNERPDHTLQPTALVNEAYLRMASQRTVNWRNRAQLLAIAARMMRRVLLDHAAARNAGRRLGNAIRVSLTEDIPMDDPRSGIDILDLDLALERLRRLDAEQATVAELRFFGGMKNEEIAEVLGLSPTTVGRRWSSGRLWLVRQLEGNNR